MKWTEEGWKWPGPKIVKRFTFFPMHAPTGFGSAFPKEWRWLEWVYVQRSYRYRGAGSYGWCNDKFLSTENNKEKQET